MKIAKIVLKIIIILFTIVFILFPIPNSDLIIRVHFMNADTTKSDEITSGTCALYYAIDDPYAFSPEQVIISEIDVSTKQVSFKLDGSLSNKLSGIRLDFPNADNLICVSNVTISSAGIIQKQFNPCIFFASENILDSNDIDDISLATSLNRAYIKTKSVDPYLILSDSLVSQISAGYSSYRLTRLAICIFIYLTCYLAKKNIFSKK